MALLCSDGAPTFAFALIPLWDMINHANGHVTSRHDPTAQQTECVAMADFHAGEQIFMFYGERPNAELLLYSGFVMEYNPHDYMLIKLGVCDVGYTPCCHMCVLCWVHSV